MKGQHSVEAFCALLFAVCVLIALMLLTGCTRPQAAQAEPRLALPGQRANFPAGSPAIERVGAPAERDVVLPGRLVNRWGYDPS